MKVGIKKNGENEWLVHVGCASIKMDRFSIELLNLTLEHVISLRTGEVHSILKSYIKLGQQIQDLDDDNTQKLLRLLDNGDLLNLMLVAKDKLLNKHILSNVGGILNKQLQADLKNTAMPDEEVAKESIKRIAEKMFELEGRGDIEFIDQAVRYI